MKKVGIVSCYFKNNYGSLLQAYATQKFLEDNNIPNETINVSQLKDFSKGKKKYYLSQITNFGFIKTKFGMIKFKVYSKINKRLKTNISIRNKKFNDFKRVFNLTKAFYSYKELSDYTVNRYSDVIVGSDQLWLPVNVVSDYYTLNWVPDKINKISYATSFGISEIPNKYKELYKSFLTRINNISVREKTAVNLVKDTSNVSATLVCDPTLLLSKEEWMSIQTGAPILKEKYIFCYFLGNNIEHRKFVEKLKEKTGYKIVSINHCDEYVKYSDKFADIIPYDVGPGDFLNYIRNAEYVCTDSFHGTIFSLIYNTEFFTFERFNKKSKMSTNSRIQSLLDVAGLKNRIVYGIENIDEIDKKIDFEKANKKLETLINKSKKWLLNAIEWKPDKHNHISIEEKSDCCGCTACMNICPQKAIKMREDIEGFLYPTIDEKKCINCGLCKKTCPIANPTKELQNTPKGLVLNNKDNQIRKESTSGGAFSAIANCVISKGGVVFGAVFDANFNVIHKGVKTEKEVALFRNSKYVQSNPKNSFREVEKFLKEKKFVCFSGTPCQIEGLKKYLKTDYDNLLLVDIVCRAVPSPKLLRLYLKYIKSNKLYNEKIEKVLFRDKSKYGYKYTMMTVKSKNHIYQEGIDTDPYLRAFFSGLAIRPSCENCKFKKLNRLSDITMWDCFNVDELDKNMDDNLGTTRLLIHSEKGEKIFNEIKNKIDFTTVDVEKLTRDSKELMKPTFYNTNRKEFLSKINNSNFQKIIEFYFPNSARVKTERFFRRKLVKMQGYKRLKRLLKKVIGKY